MGRGAKIAIAVVVAIPVVAIAIAALNAPGGFVKDYRFPRVEIDATVMPDGSLVLDERRTYAFEGDFSFAFFTIDWPPELIRDFSISEGGRPVSAVPVADGSGGVRADWTFSASNEQRTFDIHYVALCAVDVYPDTAHLLWQFVGTGWEKVTDELQVRVHLPDVAGKERRQGPCPSPPTGRVPETRPLAPGEVRAWGHGPFAGQVRIPDPRTVVLTVRDLRPFTFVEGSIVFPKGSVPFAPLEFGRSLDSIVAEQAALAEEANALRRQHRLEVAFAWFLIFGLPILMVALIAMARRRDRVAGVPRHLQEPPEAIHPVELAVLWSTAHGSLSPKTAYRAQLLHLAQTGAIEVLPIGPVSDPEDFQLRLVGQPDDLDREFVRFLFAEDGQRPISLEDVKARGTRRDRLTSWWKRVGTKSKASVEKIVKGRTRIESSIAFVAALGAGLYGYWRSIGFDDSTAVLFDGPLGLFGAVLIPEAVLVYLIGRRFMPARLPPALRERVARWASFRRFLTEFQTMSDAPALAVTIWENYLVYAVALGVADEVEEQVRALVPAERLPEPWPGAPSGDAGYAYYHRSIGSSPAHVASNAATAVGWSSGWGSSSGGGGGGGGFSGGGGGGGGGTGGGAG